jgi:hypothetical protein
MFMGISGPNVFELIFIFIVVLPLPLLLILAICKMFNISVPSKLATGMRFFIALGLAAVIYLFIYGTFVE